MGFLLIDKPKGMTSHDVIDRVRKITSERRVGHAGTLDPNATGLLVVGVTREFTKQLGDIAKDTTKTYIAEIILGEERETDDVEGEIRETHLSGGQPKKELVLKAIKKFTGKQKQTPPAYSALKIKGKKAYELARRGKEVKLEPRNVEIFKANLINYKFPKLEIEFEVSSGTYIRSLARDIGRELKTGAYLNNLRRTKIGKFDIKDAKTVDEL